MKILCGENILDYAENLNHIKRKSFQHLTFCLSLDDFPNKGKKLQITVYVHIYYACVIVDLEEFLF